MQVSHASASAGIRPAYLPRGIRSGQPGCRSCGDSQARQPARAEKDSIAERMPYNYVSSDGKKKATLEDAIMESRSSSGSEQIQQNSSMAKNQPWNMGWQMSERNLLWNDDLAARLLKRVTAEELHCSDEELEERFKELIAVMPGLTKRMSTMKPALLAKLTENPAAVAAKLLKLKGVFPTANVEQMVLRDFRLLLTKDVPDVQAAAEELRNILPDVDVDRLCQEHPSMLEIESFKEALEEVRRLMPKLNIATALNTQPEIIFSTQRAKSMIPYDPVPGNTH